jgi:hypothetical protein
MCIVSGRRRSAEFYREVTAIVQYPVDAAAMEESREVWRSLCPHQLLAVEATIVVMFLSRLSAFAEAVDRELARRMSS